MVHKLVLSMSLIPDLTKFNPTFLTLAKESDYFFGINRIYFESWNCPNNCLQCANLKNAGDKCLVCKQGFKVNLLGKCGCEVTTEEMFSLETMKPDVLDLALSENNNVLESYCVEFVSVQKSLHGCHENFKLFANSKFLKTEIQTTTVFGTFYLNFTNSNGF